ncbi:MAG: hypothetical protein QHH75_15380 [Bacillota bacterium]|nr:hypothetical protein [Bacillota bacterium]
MEEIKRAIVSIPFLIGLLVCTMAGLTGVIYDLPYGEGSGANYLFRCFHSLISILPLLAPVIATIPFANSYASERNSGFSKFIMQRLPVSSYKAAKLISNALAGGLVLAIPLTGAFLWFTIKYPIVPKPYTISGAFGELFTTNPIAYMWILIGLSFLFGATFATIGLAFSVLFSNQFFANILPLVVYIDSAEKVSQKVP